MAINKHIIHNQTKSFPDGSWVKVPVQQRTEARERGYLMIWRKEKIIDIQKEREKQHLINKMYDLEKMYNLQSVRKCGYLMIWCKRRSCNVKHK